MLNIQCLSEQMDKNSKPSSVVANQVNEDIQQVLLLLNCSRNLVVFLTFWRFEKKVALFCGLDYFDNKNICDLFLVYEEKQTITQFCCLLIYRDFFFPD